jgi:hypothetical protein
MLTTRPPVALLLGLSSLLALGGCGDKKAATIDAPVVKILDAAIDATPDAPPCATQVCGGVCVDTATDPMHCGSCTNVCQSGASCVGATPACTCPGAFLAADHPASGTDIFQVAGGIQIAIGLENGGGGLNGLVVGYVPATVQLNHAYDLAGAAVGTPPLVAAGYHFSVATMLPESAFYATAGTLQPSRPSPA